jgi:hypothetical protein
VARAILQVKAGDGVSRGHAGASQRLLQRNPREVEPCPSVPGARLTARASQPQRARAAAFTWQPGQLGRIPRSRADVYLERREGRWPEEFRWNRRTVAGQVTGRRISRTNSGHPEAQVWCAWSYVAGRRLESLPEARELGPVEGACQRCGR